MSLRGKHGSLGKSVQRFLHAGDGHPAFPDGGGATLHRAGAHIAGGEDSGHARFERTRSALALLPGRAVRDRSSRFDEAFFIAGNLRGQPVGTRFRPDHGEHSRGFDRSAFARLHILQLDRLQHAFKYCFDRYTACPTFNANKPNLAPEKDLGARSLRDMYEPGSVEKILTTSALLNEHKVTPRTKIVVPPQLKVTDRVIHDDVAHGTWRLTLTGVIAKSSNIGAVRASSRISDRSLYTYLREFGLGTPTDVGLPGESAGASLWRPSVRPPR